MEQTSLQDVRKAPGSQKLNLLQTSTQRVTQNSKELFGY